MHAVAAARLQSRKVRRAASVAAFSGWTTAVFAALTLLGGLFSLPAFLLGVGFAVSAAIEIRGAAALRRFESGVVKRLAVNQAALAGMLCAYGAWSIFAALTAPGPYAAYLDGGGAMADAVRPIAKLQTSVTIVFYLALIVCSLIAQGGAAVYYLTRKRHIDAFVQTTPAWALDMLKAAGG